MSNPSTISTAPTRNMNSPASSNQATKGTASARKAPATQSFQVLKSSPDIKTPSARSVNKMLPNASCVTRPSALLTWMRYIATRTAAHWPNLNRHHFEPPATLRQMDPTCGDTQKRGNRCHGDPVGRDRHAQHVGPRYTNNPDDDDYKIRKFSEQADPFFYAATMGLGEAAARRRTYIRHCLRPVALARGNARLKPLLSWAPTATLTAGASRGPACRLVARADDRPPKAAIG